MTKSLTIIILLFFTISGISLPGSQMHGTGDNLRNVVIQVQNIASQADHSVISFSRSFQETVSAIQATAGLQIIYTNQANNDKNGTTAIVVYTNLPFLLKSNTELEKSITSKDLNYPPTIASNKSIILTPDSPPPIA